MVIASIDASNNSSYSNRSSNRFQQQQQRHKIGIVTGGNESKPIETVPVPVPAQAQKTELAVHTTTTSEDEIITLKSRVSRLENYLKKLSESYVLNQL
jgi:hypothetical protein